jgi:hypothetical protein
LTPKEMFDTNSSWDMPMWPIATDKHNT